MAGSVQFFGGASGLPPDLIDRLMEVEKTRYKKMQKTRTEVASQQSSFDTLSSKLLALKSKAEDLQKSTTWTPHTAASSDDTKVAMTASSEASAGVHSVSVQRLATSNSLIMGIGAGQGAGITTTQNDTGLTTGNTSLTFDYNGTSYSPTLAVGDTLQDVADKINALDFGQEDGVSASVIFDGTGNRLVMNAKDSGAYARAADGTTSSSRINVTGMQLQFGDSAVIAPANMIVTDDGKDAQLTVDGLTNVYSSSNTVSDVIAGVSMELKQVTASAVTLTVGNDKEAAKTELQGFVDSYNDVLDFVDSKKATDFTGESTIRSAIAQIRLQINTPTSGVSGLYSTLSQMGVETNAKTGRLAINATKFDDTIAKDFNSLRQIFSDEPATGDKGLAFRLEELTNSLTKSSGGIVTTKKTGLGDTLKRLDANLDREDRRLEKVRERLVKKYARLEQTISTLSGSAGAMSSMLGKL